MEYTRATELYEDEVECPIEWSYFPDLTEKAIMAYELRRPWDTRGPPFERMPDIMKLQLAHKYSHENVRKMFGRANLAVFNATGVYFLFSSLGLSRRGHDVPTDKTILKDLSHANCPRVRIAKQTESGGSFYSSPLQCFGKVSNILLKLPGVAGHTHRSIPAEMATKYGIEEAIVIECSPEVFDRWYSCLCFGLRHSVPKRVYTLKSR